MPLGISPSVRPIRLRPTPLPTCFDRNVLSPTLLLQHDSKQKVVLSFLVPHYEQNTAIDPSAGMKTPLSPEYKGRIAYVNKNLGFVLKAEQGWRVIGITRPMHLGTASGVNAPLVSSNCSIIMT